jgi:adenine-specific DNA methylase
MLAFNVQRIYVQFNDSETWVGNLSPDYRKAVMDSLKEFIQQVFDQLASKTKPRYVISRYNRRLMIYLPEYFNSFRASHLQAIVNQDYVGTFSTGTVFKIQCKVKRVD